AESEHRSWERSETCLGRLVDVGAPGSIRPAGPDTTTAPAFPPTERGTRAPTPGLVVPPAPPSRRAAVARGASRRGRGRGGRRRLPSAGGWAASPTGPGGAVPGSPCVGCAREEGSARGS